MFVAILLTICLFLAVSSCVRSCRNKRVYYVNPPNRQSNRRIRRPSMENMEFIPLPDLPTSPPAPRRAPMGGYKVLPTNEDGSMPAYELRSASADGGSQITTILNVNVATQDKKYQETAL